MYAVRTRKMLTTLAISNYRSLRELVIPLKKLNIVTGPNGSGKSSLYRALRLLADTAQGRVVSSIAREGGLQSTLWAGPESTSRSMRRGDYPVQGTRRTHPVKLRLGFASDEYGYLIDMGLPTPNASASSAISTAGMAGATRCANESNPGSGKSLYQGFWKALTISSKSETVLALSS